VKVGIGLPNPVPGVGGRTLVEWARLAEERGFSSVATIDRIAYPSYESLIALVAAAAATERIGLMTNILLGPTRNPILLAKESASLDQVSGGRFTLGIGVGSRPDDYEAAERAFANRGRRLDDDLELLHRAWRGDLIDGAQKPVGPRPVNGDRVPVLIGGMTDKAIERTLRWGVGWTVGGAPPDVGGTFAERVRRAWKEADREGEPLIVGLSYFALGDDAAQKATEYLGDYYGDYGRQLAGRIPITPTAVRETIERFADHGFDELFLDPTSADLEQVELLADAVL